MNADGLYLVSYYALLLNLKLCTCDYYHRKPAPALFTLVRAESNVLMATSVVYTINYTMLSATKMAKFGFCHIAPF